MLRRCHVRSTWTQVSKMLRHFTSAVMGHVISIGTDITGACRSPRRDPEFQKSINQLVAMAGTGKISDREKRHVTAMKLCADGLVEKAIYIWEDILVDHPLDSVAIKMSLGMGFRLYRLRDCLSRVMPHWTRDMPHYGFLIGMYAFGLCETNMFDQAERMARKALQLDRGNAWATHTLAHVLETQGRWEEGIAFYSSTVQDWEPCTMFACHNYWHWALFYIEKGEYQSAIDIYDSQVFRRASTSGGMLDMADSCAMLWRLEMEGVDVGDRWKGIYEVCRPLVDVHVLVFNDIHMLMSYLRAKKTDTVAKMMASINDYIECCNCDNSDISRDVGVTICEAFAAYSDGEFAKAVDLLNPIRYKVCRIGGSNAQRDIFNLFLINATLRSPLPKHHRLAR
ncbi:hypothetical protein NP493_966g00006 [Ridgeia piscesae]|uniref:Tetratricopeptide repeat protein 38 n=1 Tax=Ridgeia piscesae TaxID=27915 RepID=A0AAD9NJA6_RIDPI|nr:hypothetical protein NP493_966g00006 [Ridgeia piscesae]